MKATFIIFLFALSAFEITAHTKSVKTSIGRLSKIDPVT